VRIETLNYHADNCRKPSLSRGVCTALARAAGRGLPALSLGVDNGTALHRVLLSTHQADELARELGPSG
jgi:hypothetical protein